MPFSETSALASSKVYYHSVVIRSQAVIGNHAFIVRVDSKTRFYCDIWGDGIYRTATRVGYVCTRNGARWRVLHVVGGHKKV